jgi:ABC-type polysaccharide/polyol phosphate export permease
MAAMATVEQTRMMPPSDRGVVVIQPTGGAVWPRLREAWENRELLLFLTLRDIKARYVQTALGWFWTVFQPLGLMLVFTFAFHRLGDVESDGVAYPVFALTGLAFWTYFQRAVTEGSQSLVLNAPLLTKTSCPRLLMPLSAVAAPFVDLVTSYAVAIAFVLVYGIEPTWRWLVLPLPIALGIALTAGLGILLSALNVRYRDIRNALPFLIQFLLFISPFAYSLSSVHGTGELIVSINPLVGIVEGIRWSLLDTPAPSAVAIGFSCAITALLLACGLRYFSRFARDFADVA